VNFLELAQKRQSDRNYLPDTIDREVIDRCIEAARLAPSACNSQPWKFIVVDDPDLRKKVAEKLHDFVMKGNSFALTAPVLIAIVEEAPNITSGIGGFLKNKQYALIDIGISAEHFCLQAAEEGIGTCMLGWFDEKAVQKLLKIPSNRRIPLVITLGKPVSGETRLKNRKTIDTIRTFNSYRE